MLMARLYRAAGLRRGRMGRVSSVGSRTHERRPWRRYRTTPRSCCPRGRACCISGLRRPARRPSRRRFHAARCPSWPARGSSTPAGRVIPGGPRSPSRGAAWRRRRGSADHRVDRPRPRGPRRGRASGRDQQRGSSPQADGPRIRRIVDDLDPDRVHVVLTLRPLARILPSSVAAVGPDGVRLAVHDWLATQLESDAAGGPRSFWFRHRHDRLIGRWAEVVGPERMTTIVLDDSDRSHVLRVFEGLTGCGRARWRSGPTSRTGP